jgi:hypothetical protein
VFAGAAREAVFSNPDVIKHINANFIPVALKAGLVNRPPNDEEGLLYREIVRSKPAPQGICVVNSAGKVLDWTLMFDDDKSLLAFFDHAKERYSQFPDAKKPVTAEVYQKFPSQKRKDVEDSGKVLPVLDHHPEGKRCPAEPALPKGTVVVRLVGRALDNDGLPVTDTVRQENYIEDRFNIEVETQERLAKAFTAAGRDPVKLPLEVTRQWVKQAFMGVLDVQPLDNPGGNQGELKGCNFTATRFESAAERTVWHVEGASDVFIDRMANAGPGDMHAISLTWHGFIEMSGSRIARLTLSATGREKLKSNSARAQDINEVAILPGGHRIDRTCKIRFGLLGEPAYPERVSVDTPAQEQREVPEEARRQIVETLGPPFLVFRNKVQEELKLSDEQKQKIQKRLIDTVQDAMQFFQKLDGGKPEEREKELTGYREKTQATLTAFLEGLLHDAQSKRLRQVMLQREGLLALGNAEIMKELELTDKQRQQFVEIVEAMQKKIAPLLNEAQKGGKQEEIRAQVMKIRAAHVDRIDAILSVTQRKQWKELPGKPVNLDD